MKFGHCEHNKTMIENLPFHCDECVRKDEREKIYQMLKFYSVTAPEESRAATFTVEQFKKAMGD